jgi:hypothetical protein
VHIISASRRTDIPAFYSDWFMERIRAETVSWVQPFNGRIVTVSLASADVAAIVFWTRNFGPMTRHLQELSDRGHRTLVHYTITLLPRAFETHVPEVSTAVERFREVAGRLGAERVLWRYDPIMISAETGVDFHLRAFESLAASLQGATRQCTLSFVQVYGKVRRNFTKRGLPLPEPGQDLRRRLAIRLGEIGAARGIEVKSCCGDELLGGPVGKARCVDRDQILRLWPELEVGARASPTREECGCCHSWDVGAYDTCLHGCVYCYATRDRAAAQGRHAKHDPRGATLIPVELPGR